MRQFFTWRYWAAVGSLVVLLAILATIRDNGSPVTVVETANTRRIDLIARTSTVRSDGSWSVADGVSRGNATAVLQSGRLLTITDGTLGQSSCLSPEVPDSCVILADTLGDGIVWFALVPAPPIESNEVELPPIEELLDGVTYARLTNGWEVPLLDKVVRRCDDETANLAAFVERFGTSHVTIVDLGQSQVSAVRCT
ncbi:MAG: hypothetical protein ACO3SP_03635 [Ilumatobacteraceae bacterium]